MRRSLIGLGEGQHFRQFLARQVSADETFFSSPLVVPCLHRFLLLLPGTFLFLCLCRRRISPCNRPPPPPGLTQEAGKADPDLAFSLTPPPFHPSPREQRRRGRTNAAYECLLCLSSLLSSPPLFARTRNVAALRYKEPSSGSKFSFLPPRFSPEMTGILIT